MNSSLDIVICSIPRMSIYYPPAAPAILKANIIKHGFTCSTVDFVIRFYERFFQHPLWEKIDNWMAVPTLNDSEVMALIKPEIDSWAEELVSKNPRWIGISVFSYESHKITKLLCMAIRKKNQTVKIVLGGMGVTDDNNMFGTNMKQQSLCDDIIVGDGEQAVIDLLQEKNTEQFYRLTDLDELPYADWSDYDLDAYKAKKAEQHKKQSWQGYNNAWYRSDEILTLPIVGSRGCVRSCSFCDIPNLWPKYQTRSADNLAREIISNYENYNVQRFHFTDSLMNGNMKNFRSLCDILAEYRVKNSADFTITGQYIIRSHSSETDHDYEMMNAAGFTILEAGVESGSESVRWHMGKKFTNEDIDVFMERIKKYNLKVVFMLIVGYPTETEEDFRATLDMLTKYKPFLDSGNIVEACLGGTLRIESNTKLANDKNVVFNIVHRSRDDLDWEYKTNPMLTLRERIRRRFVLLDHSLKLGYSSPTNNQELLYLKSKWEELQDR